MKKPVLFILCIFNGMFCFAQDWLSSSNINLKDPQPGQYGKLEEIYFEIDGPMSLRPHSRAVLDSVVAFVTAHPQCFFQVEVHTDCRADSSYNMAYSQVKADSIIAYMGRKISVNRIRGIGKGESEPVTDCRCEGVFYSRRCTEEEYQKDRRVLLRVVDGWH